MALGRVSSPWLMLPPSFENGGMSYNFYSLAENRVVSLKKKSKQGSESPNDNADVVGSSHGWLALYYRRDHSLFLSNPITGENIKLPPIDAGRILKDVCAVRSVILSSPPHQQDCRAIISYVYGSMMYLYVAVCSPGRSSVWTDINIYDPHEDIVYSATDRLFFGLLEDEVEAWDCTDPSDPKLTYDRVICFCLDHEEADRTARETEVKELYGEMWHLVYVEHTDQLLFVKRYIVEQMVPAGTPIEEDWEIRLAYPHKTVVFYVYEIDVHTGRLRYMEDSLDGLVLFVGINHSLAVRAAEFPELKPDSIYFTEAKPFAWPPYYMYGGHDIGIFDYKNKTISPCYYPCDHRSFKKIYPSPLWFTPSPH